MTTCLARVFTLTQLRSDHRLRFFNILLLGFNPVNRIVSLSATPRSIKLAASQLPTKGSIKITALSEEDI